MAYNNILFKEAEKLIKGTIDKNSSRAYNRYTNPSACPKLKKIMVNSKPNQANENMNSVPGPSRYKSEQNYNEKLKIRESFKNKEEKMLAANRKKHVDYYKNFNPKEYNFLQEVRGVPYIPT